MHVFLNNNSVQALVSGDFSLFFSIISEAITMSVGSYYLKRTGKNKIVKTFFMNRYLLLCGILLGSFSTFARPAINFVPVFANGSVQVLPACKNQGAIAINSQLAVIDSDAGQTEFWSVSTAPANGSLGGLSTTAVSGGGLTSPSGVSYTPAPGFTGFDTFVVSVFDGFSTSSTTIIVHVNALPVLSSTLTPPSVCDQTVFSYTPTSASGGATFTWHRSFAGGISNPTTGGTGNPNETLTNTTYYDVPVTYVYTVTAGGCSSVQSVVVTIHPTPRLSSKLFDTTCTGATYSYIPVTPTSGTVYTWTRAEVGGILPATATGTGNINEMLTSSLPAPATVTYSFALSANGCNAVRNLSVYVIPQPPVTSITTSSPDKMCAGTLFQSFGAGIAPPAGVSYSWSTVNADIWATSADGQYILVNFMNPGDASVTLMINGSASSCTGNSTYAVNVGPEGPAASTILYYNYQFIYLDNTAAAYQWGYDDAHTLAPTVITGAVFQSYPTTMPDFVNNYYWVMVYKNGCMQKVYYNSPAAVTNVLPGSGSAVEVYPSPAGDVVNVAIAVAGKTEVTITNMLGQVVKAKTFNGNSIQLNVSDIAAGGYLVSCTQNGVKVGTARFIKN